MPSQNITSSVKLIQGRFKKQQKIRLKIELKKIPIYDKKTQQLNEKQRICECFLELNEFGFYLDL